MRVLSRCRYRRGNGILSGLVPLLLAVGWAAAPAQAATRTASCPGLQGQLIGGIRITQASRIDAAGAVPGYCKILAIGAGGTTLDIEVDLPDGWQGRLLHEGGGGFDGRLPSVEATSAQLPLMPILQRGVAYAASNGGNRSGNPAELVANAAERADYAYAALPKTVHFAKAVTQAFYGVPPRRTYFHGISNGGRNAYTVAAILPTDYDGIIAGAETMQMATQMPAILGIVSRAGTAAMPSTAQWTAAYQAATAACGNANGVILDPGNCDPGTLACGTSAAATCLTPAQLATVRDLIRPQVLPVGPFAGNYWADFGTTLDPAAFFSAAGLAGGYAAMATLDPAWLLPAPVPGSLQASYNAQRDAPVIARGLRQQGLDPSLSAIALYAASGRKLLSFSGGADPLISARDHVANWQRVRAMAAAIRPGAQGNMRFFLEPGVGHGFGGPGPDQFDYLGVLIEWVEQGRAPERVIGSKLDAKGAVVATLPACAWPTLPRYRGGGSISDAASYVCRATPGAWQ
jgi:hypothetical protein